MTIKPALGQCPRCQGLCYVCDVDTIYTAADMTPLGQAAAIQAVIAGRDLYRLENDPDTGRPSRLRLLTARTREPGTEDVILGSHGCGAEARSVVPWTPGAVEAPKGPAAPLAQSPAPNATPSPSDWREREAWKPEPAPFKIDWDRVGADYEARPDCEICKNKIIAGQDMIGVQLGEIWTWARHTERCV